MITLKTLKKEYTTPQGIFVALDQIDLQVQPGEIFGIIGESGAGKSTLIRCINLLEKPTSGQVIVDGQNLMTLTAAQLRRARHKMGMIFQHFNLLNSRTVYENVALPLEFCRFSRKQIDLAITPLLELTGLSERKSHYPAQLSGGQKQRVAIARALAYQPKILLSDEATSALDPNTTQMILQLLKNIRDTLKLTIVLITHEMSVIKSCCDQVAILDRGKIIEANEVGAFFSHPQTVLAREFVISTLPHDLPPAIGRHLRPEKNTQTHPVFRIWFQGKTTTQPVITQLIGQFHLRVNILQASVEYVKEHTIGVMIIAVDGDPERLQAAISYLQTIGIQLEVLGHVPNDIIPFI